MLHTQLNIYSLLIPLMMLSLGMSTLVVYQFKKFAAYLLIYAYALVCIGFSVLLHTILQPEWVVQCIPLIFSFYFLSCALHSYAIYQRLNLSNNHYCLVITVVLGVICISYYQEQQVIRLLIIGVVTTILYLQRPLALLQHRAKLTLDRLIKIAMLSIVIIALGRAIGLSILLDQSILISSYAMIWASTQLLLIIIDMLFLALFISCAMLDTFKQLYHERAYDPLTGLLNRRALDEYLQRLSYPSTQPTHVLVLADLDHFKQINDQYGHSCGDLALQHVSQLLQSHIRRSDRIARIGGEEFCIVLTHISLQQAIERAEYMRQRLAATPLTYQGQQIELNISMGLCSFCSATEITHAYLKADQLLYQAKRMGRNAVHAQLIVDKNVAKSC